MDLVVGSMLVGGGTFFSPAYLHKLVQHDIW